MPKTTIDKIVSVKVMEYQKNVEDWLRIHFDPRIDPSRYTIEWEESPLSTNEVDLKPDRALYTHTQKARLYLDENFIDERTFTAQITIS